MPVYQAGFGSGQGAYSRPSWMQGGPANSSPQARDPMYWDTHANPTAGGAQGGVGGIYDIMNQQRDSNAQARGQNQQQHDQTNSYLLGLDTRNQSNPVTQQSNSLLQGYLKDPYTLNDTMRNQMLNQSSANINAGLNAQYKQGVGSLAAAGQGDQQSMSALQERLGLQGLMANTNANTDINTRAAMMKQQDMQSAIGLGQNQQRMDQSFGLGMGGLMVGNKDQYMPEDLSGWGSLMAQQQNQGGRGGMTGGGGPTQRQQGGRGGNGNGNYYQGLQYRGGGNGEGGSGPYQNQMSNQQYLNGPGQRGNSMTPGFQENQMWDEYDQWLGQQNAPQQVGDPNFYAFGTNGW